MKCFTAARRPVDLYWWHRTVLEYSWFISPDVVLGFNATNLDQQSSASVWCHAWLLSVHSCDARIEASEILLAVYSFYKDLPTWNLTVTWCIRKEHWVALGLHTVTVLGSRSIAPEIDRRTSDPLILMAIFYIVAWNVGESCHVLCVSRPAMMIQINTSIRFFLLPSPEAK